MFGGSKNSSEEKKYGDNYMSLITSQQINVEDAESNKLNKSSESRQGLYSRGKLL